MRYISNVEYSLRTAEADHVHLNLTKMLGIVSLNICRFVERNQRAEGVGSREGWGVGGLRIILTILTGYPARYKLN